MLESNMILMRLKLNQHLGIATAVSNATKLGKKGNKSRLLQVTVSSYRDKVLILWNSTKVRSKDGEEFLKKLYITPDLTPIECEQNKALRSKLKEMNQQGRQYRIKNGRITLREDKAPSAQQPKWVWNAYTQMHKVFATSLTNWKHAFLNTNLNL